MKKFLLLSFLMVAFVSAVSYAQNRTVTYTSTTNAPPRLQWSIDANPSEPYKRDVILDVQPGSTTVSVRRVSYDISYISTYYGYGDYSRSTDPSVAPFLTFNIDLDNHGPYYEVTYGFEVFYEDETWEAYVVVEGNLPN